jgi:TPR repeat protein
MLDVPCDASANISIAQAEERAEQLMEVGDLANATCWLRIGASQGDAAAQGALASILYRGVGVPVNIREASLWAEKAAAQNDFLGDHVLSNMYAKGDGKPKDPAKAEYWRARYEKDKLTSERAQQQAQEAQRQRAQAQAQQNQEAGVMMLQLLLGAFSADSESPRKSSIVCSAGYGYICANSH